jgi:hypothetical protein
VSYEKELEKQNEQLQRKLAASEECSQPWVPVWIAPYDGEWHYRSKLMTLGKVVRTRARGEEGSPVYNISLILPFGDSSQPTWTPYQTLAAAKEFIERSFTKGDHYVVIARIDDDE